MTLFVKIAYFKFMGDTRSNVELMALSYASNTIFFFSISWISSILNENMYAHASFK